MAKKTEKTTEAVEQPPVPEAAGLNISDIRSCVSIIDIVTKRGAFEGVELSDVGSLRNRLDNFLKAADEAQAARVEAEAETPAE
jgi:hypothetical protein